MKLIEKYTVQTSKKSTKPGCWDYLLVEIFQTSEDGIKVKIGEYTRNYSSLYDTFYPFTQNGKEYALYSKDYTSTRVMRLPECVDIAGEEDSEWGFCPTEYYVPSDINDEDDDNVWNLHITFEVNREEDGNIHCGDKKYINMDKQGTFGFVAGCVWGDDTSWKIQYLDLSGIEKGELKRIEKFGYIEMPRNISSLKSCISLYNFENVAIAQDVEHKLT